MSNLKKIEIYRTAVSGRSVTKWTPPQLHEGREWYVDFYAADAGGNLRRKKYTVRRCATTRERRKAGKRLVKELEEKLAGGWLPWPDVEPPRRDTMAVLNVADEYAEWNENNRLSGVIRRWTYLDRKSQLNNFISWLRAERPWVVNCGDIDAAVVSSFLDHVLFKRRVSLLTRNNYRAWLYHFCDWMQQRGYVKENPVRGIRKLRVVTKQRRPFTAEELRLLVRYVEAKGDRWFLLAIMMEYYTFVRPVELCRLRVGDVDIPGGRLFIPAAASKNYRDYMVGLNGRLCTLMEELGLPGAPKEWYLFGKGMKPSPAKGDGRMFRDKFTKVRAALGWGMDKQFYGLKDSGIRDLANEAGIVVARDQARHQDVSTTNRYLVRDALTVHIETQVFRGAL